MPARSTIVPPEAAAAIACATVANGSACVPAPPSFPLGATNSAPSGIGYALSGIATGAPPVQPADGSLVLDVVVGGAGSPFAPATRAAPAPSRAATSAIATDRRRRIGPAT